LPSGLAGHGKNNAVVLTMQLKGSNKRNQGRTDPPVRYEWGVLGVATRRHVATAMRAQPVSARPRWAACRCRVFDCMLDPLQVVCVPGCRRSR